MERADAVPLRSKATNPPGSAIEGSSVCLQALNIDHTESLFGNIAGDVDGSNWYYIPDGPFKEYEPFSEFIRDKANSENSLFYSVINKDDGQSVGICSLMRVDLPNSCIEIGYIIYSPKVQRTTITTECIYLLLKHIFEDLNFRRCEWKCDDANKASMAAAKRFGFQYEGTFRQHMIYKGRNRDTAWFSIVDKEWPEAKRVFEEWLRPENFDANGKQQKRLEDFR